MRLSFALKLALLNLLLAFTITGLGVGYFYYTTREMTLRQMRQHLGDVTHVGSYIFSEQDRIDLLALKQEILPLIQYNKSEVEKLEDGDTLPALSDSVVARLQKSSRYLKLIQKMRRIKAGTTKNIHKLKHLPQVFPEGAEPTVKFVYIMFPLEGFGVTRQIFLADSDYAEIDENKNGKIDDEEVANPIGNIYAFESDAYNIALKGSIAIEDEWYTDKWGTWLSAFLPILDHNGKTIAVLGLDLNVVGAANKLLVLRNVLIGVMIASFVLAILLSFVLARLMSRSVLLLKEGAEQVAQRNFDVQIEVKSKDELGDLADVFNSMVHEIQDYSQNLENKVEKRTRQLQESLEKVRNLKFQQDGDYFLTSLLTDTLIKDRYNGEVFKVEYLIYQKKKFEFRKKKSELGGDFCSMHSLILKGRPYLLFVNADAMGKSIQGAGGALVFGAVFESLVTRTSISGVASDFYPERWLKNAFIELHKVFEAFDGSMLMSVVLGLADEKTGLVYYMNAEHPAPVLYNKQESRFLHPDVLFRKIGAIGINDGVYILTCQLQTGDVFLSGSDGRDDLLLGTDDDGTRIINEDETRFLSVVNQSKADINEIYSQLLQTGELTDDISLLSIEYTGSTQSLVELDVTSQDLLNHCRALSKQKNWSAAWEKLCQIDSKKRTHPDLLRETALILFKLKKYKEALQPALDFCETNPSDTGILYLISLLSKKLKKLEQATDYADRVRLRMPMNVENLVNLADIYYHTNDVSRARKLLDQALEFEPANRHALRLNKKFGLKSKT